MSSAPWSSKASKSFLEGADQFMILDSATVVAADINKRVTGTVTKTFFQTPFLAQVSAATFKLVNLGAPTADTDAATKKYVDDNVHITTLSWKEPVRVATVIGGTLSTDFENGDTVDGVTLQTGDRILIKDQASGGEDGIYTVNASGAPSRSADAQLGDNATGFTLYIEQGTINSRRVLLNTNSINFGAGGLTFENIAATHATNTFAEVQSFGKGIVIVNEGTGNNVSINSDFTDQRLSIGGVLSIQDGLEMNNNKIVNVATPTANNDAANKSYVDGVATVVTTWKDPVVAATVVNGNLATDFEGGDVIDGVTLNLTNRILIKDQTATGEDGIYIVKASGPPDRSGDAQSGNDANGFAIYVKGGIVNGERVLFNTAVTTLGTDAFDFEQLAGTHVTNTFTQTQTFASTFTDTINVNNVGTGANPVIASNFSDQRLLLVGGMDLTDSIGMGNEKITNLATPTISTDAANKDYVDNNTHTTTLSWKNPVVATTVGNIDILTDLENGDVIDGVTLVTGDRVLVHLQTLATEDGIYDVVASGSGTRSADAQSGNNALGFAVFTKEGGTVNASKVFINVTDITIGSTSFTMETLAATEVANVFDQVNTFEGGFLTRKSEIINDGTGANAFFTSNFSNKKASLAGGLRVDGVANNTENDFEVISTTNAQTALFSSTASTLGNSGIKISAEDSSFLEFINVELPSDNIWTLENDTNFSILNGAFQVGNSHMLLRQDGTTIFSPDGGSGNSLFNVARNTTATESSLEVRSSGSGVSNATINIITAENSGDPALFLKQVDPPNGGLAKMFVDVSDAFKLKIDIQVDPDALTNVMTFILDGTNPRVGVGQENPVAAFHVESTETTGNPIGLFDNTLANEDATFVIRHLDGTSGQNSDVRLTMQTQGASGGIPQLMFDKSGVAGYNIGMLRIGPEANSLVFQSGVSDPGVGLVSFMIRTNGQFDLQSGMKTPTRSVSGTSESVLDADIVLFVDGVTTDTVTLPDAATGVQTSERFVMIKNIASGGTNTFNLVTTAGNIEGAGTFNMTARIGVILSNDGTDWWIMGRF